MKQSKRELKRQRRSRIWMGLITIIVMVGGGVGIFADQMSGGQNSLPYNEYKFKNTVDGWQVKLDGKNTYFNYHPTDLEQINVSGDLSILKGKTAVYLTNNPNSGLAEPIARAQKYLSLAFSEYFNMYPVNAFSVETEYQVPTITCDNATEEVPVVTYLEGDMEITQEGNCVYLYSSDEYTAVRVTERLIYSMFGVME